VLLAASFGDPPTLAKVEALKADPVMVSAAADALATAPAGAPRWAAVLVLANATGTATPLVPLLKDADVTIRVMAAIGAIGQGERAGFPVLIEALSHDEYMAGFEPPATAWATASLALARHTALVLGPALDADAADRDASTRRWQDWWTKNETSLHFDVATEEWSA
jgi:HEAT repeat protein